VNALKNGDEFSDELTIDILNAQITSNDAQVRGYILDLPYNTNRKESWSESIRNAKLKCSPFSYIVDLHHEDNDIKLRAKHMRVDPEDGKEYSRWEREERKKPKPKKYNEDGEEIEEEEEDEENKLKILDED
jgi:transposase